MIISLARKHDALQIAKIHKAEINKGFLSSLSVPFLKNLYSAIIESDVGFCVVVKENDAVVGFISGVVDINALYVHFLKKYFFQSIILLFKKFFSFSYIKKMFEILLYPVKESKLPPAELLTMAVSRQFQGQGIAGKMFTEFLTEMKKRKITSFKVLVGEDLKPAIHFYEKSGFTFLKRIAIHQGTSSRIYIYDIT